jgi:hypothetical protein
VILINERDHGCGVTFLGVKARANGKQKDGGGKMDGRCEAHGGSLWFYLWNNIRIACLRFKEFEKSDKICKSIKNIGLINVLCGETYRFVS